MNTTFAVGILGSLILVAGAAYPDMVVPHPTKSVKNWLFAIGGLVMFIYAFLNYQAGGSIFFVNLETLVLVASALMMLGTSDAIDTPVIGVSGLVLILWSFYLFEDLSTLVFIIGLSCVGLGYAFSMGSLRRQFALMAGSALIALFSFIQGAWIFYWLNFFFALFSGYYAWKISEGERRKRQMIL